MSTDFNGSTSRIGVSSEAYTAGSVCGIAWAKWDTSGEGTVGTIVADAGFGLHLNAGTTSLWCRCGYGTTDATSTSGAIFAAGVWYCLAATHDEADKKNRIYYGTEYQSMQEVPSYGIQTAGVGTRATSNVSHWAGDLPGGTQSFDGRILHAVKMNYLLTLEEMERFRLGDLTVPFKRGIPHMYFTLGGANAQQDSSRHAGGTGALTKTALADSTDEPRVLFRSDWGSGRRPL